MTNQRVMSIPPREIKEQNSQSINGESVETGEDTREKAKQNGSSSGISPENTDMLQQTT